MLLNRALSSTLSVQFLSVKRNSPLCFDPVQHSLSFPFKSLQVDGDKHLGLVSMISRKSRLVSVSASNGGDSSLGVEKTRKVVEHVCLLKAKRDLAEEDEKNMLDYLYTCQYQMRGIVAISVGRISNENVENYTHAVFMRFQRKEDIAKFYKNPFYLGILEEHVTPHCNEKIYVDYESEVEDDIIPIFRKGEVGNQMPVLFCSDINCIYILKCTTLDLQEYNYGLEFVHLLAFDESSLGAPVKDALASLAKLTKEFPSLIVQSTQGSNFNPSSEYTHGIVTRFRSPEAFELFMGSKEYKEVWRSKFETITRRSLPVHYSIDPVGEDIM
ncbi:Stress-response A/B barrel domain-containing protein UP3 [Linum perenne]